MVEAPDDSDGPEADNRYHDALDEPLGDTFDLASIDEPREGTFMSFICPKLHLRGFALTTFQLNDQSTQGYILSIPTFHL